MAETEQGHRIRVGLFDSNVEEAFFKALEKVLPLLRGVSLKEGQTFRWSDHPLLKKALDQATVGLKSDLKQLLKGAIEQEYNRGLQNKISAQDAFYSQAVTKVLNAQQTALRAQRTTATAAYMKRVYSGGFSLSDRIWQIGNQARRDMATAIKAGLEDGLDYRQLARSVREYLIDPNRLYRRVRGKNGMLHLSRAAKEYHPGQGVYRSSVRNAQRVARTETNMAYRRGECDSLQGDPFVLGIRINLSANHTTTLPNGKVVKFKDICDELSNQNYPKDFKYTGWHPHCRCYMTYIMVPQDEAMEMIRKGLNYPPRSKPIKDVPQAFKNWITDNRERLEKSTSLPYFVRDNQKYITGINYTPEGLAQIATAEQTIEKSEPTTLEKARIRQAARTPEQVAEIQKRWHDRQMWSKHARGMLQATEGMKDYSEARLDLDDLLGRGMYEDASELASELRKAIKGDLKDLSLIDATFADLKKHGKWDLIATKAAVESKFDYLGKYDLATQKKKLEFEIDWVEKNKKYSTWEIAQRAYKKELANVEQEILWQEVDTSIADVEAYVSAHPKSKKVADLLAAAKEGKATGASMNYIKLKLKAAENVIKINESTKAYLAAKRGGSAAAGTFSQARKDAAVWDDGQGGRPHGKLAEDTLYDTAANAWKKATTTERRAVYDYTQSYCHINEPLQGRSYVGRQTRMRFENDVKNITRYIDRQPLPKDMWFQRGDSGLDVVKSRIEFAGGKWPADPQKLVGMIMEEGGFMSTGSAKGKGFTYGKPVIINIFAPKGTKAAYAEPFSYYGNGNRDAWKGSDSERQRTFSQEDETLFQRGTQLRITRVERVGGRYYIDAEIVGQNIRDLKYVKDSWIGY